MNYFHSLLTARGHSLLLPKALREDIDQCVQHHRVGGVDYEAAPFRRRVDLWAFSILAAVAMGLDPVALRELRQCYRFRDTRVEMSEHLCALLAIVWADGIELEELDDPNRAPDTIVNFANRLAAAGCPKVIGRLRAVDLRLMPMDKLNGYAEELLLTLGLGSGLGSRAPATK